MAIRFRPLLIFNSVDRRYFLSVERSGRDVEHFTIYRTSAAFSLSGFVTRTFTCLSQFHTKARAFRRICGSRFFRFSRISIFRQKLFAKIPVSGFPSARIYDRLSGRIQSEFSRVANEFFSRRSARHLRRIYDARVFIFICEIPKKIRLELPFIKNSLLPIPKC